MADRFNSYDALKANMVLGRDYRIDMAERPDSDFLIIAPHGGKIEKGTSELTRSIAGDDLSYYSFEGMLASGNRDLHITSHRFDEPDAVRLAGTSKTVVGIHGRRNRGDDKTIYLGGLDNQLVSSIKQQLSEGGFPAISHNHPFPARNQLNICNRGASGSGAQLELPLRLRLELLESQQRMLDLSDAIRAALFS